LEYKGGGRSNKGKIAGQKKKKGVWGTDLLVVSEHKRGLQKEGVGAKGGGDL